MKAFLSRAIGAGIAIVAGKISVVTGIVVDPATQASVAIAVYALIHKGVEQLLGKPKADKLGF